MKRRIAILGSTGSIGVNTLRVVARMPERFEVVALSAESNAGLLARQARQFRPRVVTIGSGNDHRALRRTLPARTALTAGTDGLREIVCRRDVDIVVCAISGSACREPLLQAIECGKQIALANKEALVSAGAIVMERARRRRVTIIPVDSEHSAIFQCLEGTRARPHTLYLTASGGPLLRVPRSRFNTLDRAAILRHPKWRMGKKISVDSATMMNKGLEIIEARWLFDMPQEDIRVVVHPEAIIHSMVEFTDGTVLAALGAADMRLPIQYALTYPERAPSAVPRLNFARVGALTFAAPNHRRFPALGLARYALARGATYPAVLNAADEAAVGLYLAGTISFTAIIHLVEKVVVRHRAARGRLNLAMIRAAECWAREEVMRLCSH